jgi:hypothetical protein
MKIQYSCHGRLKTIDMAHIDSKYFPPRDPGVNFDENDPATMNYIITYVVTQLENECQAIDDIKKQKEQQRIQAEREKKEKEAKEWRKAHPVAKKSPTEALSSMLRYAGSYICPGCNMRGKLKSVCTQTWCSCHGTGYRLDSLIDGINDVIVENKELKARIAELEVQANKTKK